MAEPAAGSEEDAEWEKAMVTETGPLNMEDAYAGALLFLFLN